MIVSPPIDGVRRRRPIGLAVTLIVAPLVLAMFCLVVGLFGSLAWVYLSIALSVLALPLAGVGVYLLVRRRAPALRYRFNSPPGWPEPPPPEDHG